MANRAQKDCYSNPAFSMQSEAYRWKTSPSKQTPRQSPVGANVSFSCEEKPIPGPKPKKYVQEENYDEQDFYEEMLVDDSGVVKCKKLVVVTSPNGTMKHQAMNVRYAEMQTSQRKMQHRYEMIPDDRYEETEDNHNVVYIQENNGNHPRNRYDYIPVQQEEMRSIPSSPSKRTQFKPQEIDASALKEGYALVRRNDRYEMLPLEKISDTYRYNTNHQKHRYEFIEDSDNHSPPEQRSRYEYPEPPPPQRITSPQATRRAGNPIATQKLHELLSTPKKTTRQTTNSFTPQKPMSPNTPRRLVTPAASPIPRDPFITPTKSQQTPRAQQKLNYALATRQIPQDKRHTAIIAPICSSPIQSVYSETTYSNNSESWMNLSISKAPVQATLAVAAIMMTLCGGVTSGLCFYMVWIMGRLYYLDFGIVAGFTCLLLGLLGFRSRNCRWLPNRNYISGN